MCTERLSVQPELINHLTRHGTQYHTTLKLHRLRVSHWCTRVAGTVLTKTLLQLEFADYH